LFICVQVTAGSSVAVFGLGAVGLAVVQAAKMAGASRIIGVDLNKDKFAIATTLGCTDCVCPADHGDTPVQSVIVGECIFIFGNFLAIFWQFLAIFGNGLYRQLD
jgi:S-(hydroxymethyl)glutathione dehydrogenase/alcohol dehydrogenase